MFQAGAESVTGIGQTKDLNHAYKGISRSEIAKKEGAHNDPMQTPIFNFAMLLSLLIALAACTKPSSSQPASVDIRLPCAAQPESGWLV